MLTSEEGAELGRGLWSFSDGEEDIRLEVSLLVRTMAPGQVQDSLDLHVGQHKEVGQLTSGSTTARACTGLGKITQALGPWDLGPPWWNQKRGQYWFGPLLWSLH